MDSIDIIIITSIVLFVSFLLSMLGLGGAQLYVPIFYWLGLNLKSEVIPLALLLNFVSQSSAAVTYAHKKLIDLRTGLPLLCSSTIFPFVGAYFTHRIPAKWLILIIGSILLFVSMQTFFNLKPTRKILSVRKKVLFGLIAGSCIGFLIGFLGHGGGSFIVPTLLIIGLAPKNAAATSSFVCAFSSLTGFLSHVNQVSINLNLAIICIISAVIGSQLGSRFMVIKMKSDTLKQLFATVLFLIGIQLILKELI